MKALRDPSRAVAVVGLGLALPGAESPEAFWEGTVSGRSFFREADAGDFGADPGLFLDAADPVPEDRTPSVSGCWRRPWREGDLGFLAGLRLPRDFDPAETDGAILSWLYAGSRAAAGAGGGTGGPAAGARIDPFREGPLAGHDPGSVGVMAGHIILPTRETSEAAVSLYGREATRSWDFNPFQPPPRTNPFRNVGWSAKLLSESLGLAGPSFTVDAACASALYAFRLAMMKLVSGRLTAVISGGLAWADPLFTQLGFAQLRALSRRGTSRPFDAEADGLAVGTGAAAFLLKRLDRALEDGDEILAVLLGVGLSNDQNANPLAPDPAGQLRAMLDAVRLAGASFPGGRLRGELGLIEAHGTSTVLGDRAEVRALKDCLAQTDLAGGAPPVLGSVKGGIGHLLSAAAAAAAARTVLALRNLTLPPSPGFRREAPGLELSKAPALRILKSPLPWPAPPEGLGRLAFVDAFGFGGVNAQAILEGFDRSLWAEPGTGSPARDTAAAAGAPGGADGRIPASPAPPGGAPGEAAGAPPPAGDGETPARGDGRKAPARARKSPERAAPRAGTDGGPGPAAQDGRDAAGPPGPAPAAPVSGREFKCALISARTVLAPWKSYEALARFWLTPNEPPVAGARRAGSLKAVGFFFDELTVNAEGLRLPPVELAEALPQQALSLKVAVHVLKAAGLDPRAFPPGLDRDRVGVFVGADTDPRAADWAFRWLAPLRAAEALKARGRLPEAEEEGFVRACREASGPPLTHSRVLGALGSLTASRLARWLGTGGPAFTLSEEKDSGLRALREAISFLDSGELDLAYVGVVDTFGDPKTSALSPRNVWVEGAAGMLLAGPRGAEILPPLAELRLEGPTVRLGPLSGLFAINRSGFYLRHHIKPLGRGHGLCFWVKNRDDPARQLEGPGYVLRELEGATPRALTVPPEPVRPDSWFFIRGADPGKASENLRALLELADLHPSPQEFQFLPGRFKELPGTLEGPPALAILAKSVHELGVLGRKALVGESAEDPKPRLFRAAAAPLSGRTCFLFPGSGGAYKGLGRNLCLAFPDVASEIERENDISRKVFQSELFWEPNLRRPGVQESLLAQCFFGILAYRVLGRLGIAPDFLAGPSLGESTALLASGIWPDMAAMYRDFAASPLWHGMLTPPDLATLRAHFSWPAHKPLKWSAGIFQKSAAQVERALARLSPALRHRAFLLIEYTPEECLCGGEQEAFLALAQALEAPWVPVDDAAALHSPAALPVRGLFKELHCRAVAPKPGITWYSTYHAAPVEQEREALAEAVTLQAMNAVRFPKVIERLWEDGARFFIEIGPGASVSRIVKSVLGPSRPHLAQSLSATPVDEGWAGISRVVAELFLAGYPITPEDVIPTPLPPKADGIQVQIALAPPGLAWPPAPHPELARPREDYPSRRDGADRDYLSWLHEETAGRAAGPGGDTAAGAGTGTVTHRPAPPGGSPPEGRPYTAPPGRVPAPGPGTGRPGLAAAGAAGGPGAPGDLATGPRPPFRDLPPGPRSPFRALPPVPGLGASPGGQGQVAGTSPGQDGPRIPRQDAGRPGLRTVEIAPNPRILAKTQARSRLRTVEIGQPSGIRRSFDSPKPPLFPDRGGRPFGGPSAAPGPPGGSGLPAPPVASGGSALPGRGPAGIPGVQGLPGSTGAPPRAPLQAGPAQAAPGIPPAYPRKPPPAAGDAPVPAPGAGTGPAAPAEEPAARRRGRPKGTARKEEPPAGPAGDAPPPGGPVIGREGALEFARGSIAGVFGPEWADVDRLPSRVRLPDEPLMLVDRVLALEGEPRRLGPGRIVTEHDVREGGWYLDGGRLTPGISIESGQADLMLSAWLGADAATRGLSLYRLLDAEVTFHRPPPAPGETARYDIRILKFFRHADTWMFRFEFDGTVAGRPRMDMRNGCAGFFTPGELASGRGLAAPAPRGGEASIEPGLVADPSPDPPGSLSPEDLGRIRRGDLAPFGAAFRSLAAGGEPPLPGGRLALLDSASAIDRAGGAWKGGFIRCEARVDPRAWYLESHFRGDEVMPGTLMYDASLQALRLYLMGLGWLPGQGRSFAPARGIPASLRCRGQVTPRTRSVAYDVHVKELRLEPPAPETGAGRRPGRPAKRPPEPVAVADCVMWADGRPIVEVTGMSLALAGGSLDQLASQFRKRRPKGRPPAAAARAPEAGEPGSAADPGPASRPAARQAAAPGPAPRTASRQAAPPGPAARTAAGGPTPRGRHFYPRESVRFLSSGPISGAFGPLFSRFDDGSFFPHLPQAPYDFLDEAEVIRGEPGSVAEGSELVARHELDPARWTFAEAGGPGILPYAALNETALQPCGFLASFMGSFLPFPGPMHFRNLGGEATVLRELTAADSGILETRARLTSHRAVGGMVIQNYAFSTSLRGEPVYEGVTKFGFHSPEDLARQQGVRFRADSPCPPRPPEGAVPESYPRGPAWPQGRWRMLERLLWAAPPGAGRPEAVWGRARVNPGAWFFSAHFPQDPVWPGSLGLEAFFQAAKALAFRRFRPGEDPPAAAAAFSAPVPGRRHGWEYRGQIVPLCRECSLAVQVTSAEDGLGILTFRGVLWADELPIYRVDGFSVRIHGL